MLQDGMNVLKNDQHANLRETEHLTDVATGQHNQLPKVPFFGHMVQTGGLSAHALAKCSMLDVHRYRIL